MPLFPAELLAKIGCPSCGGMLAVPGDAAVRYADIPCGKCGGKVRIEDGVLRLLNPAVLEGESAREHALRDAGADIELRLTATDPARDRAEMRSTLRALRPGPDLDVLELGAGTGRYTEPLSRTCRSVVAVDFSLESLRRLACRLPVDSRVGLVHADIVRLSVAPAAFGASLSTLASNLPSREQREGMMRLAARAAGPSGRFVFSVHHHGIIERMRGAPPEGRYGGDGIFFKQFSAREIVEETREWFASVRARPIQVRIPFAGRVGIHPLAASAVAERVPLLRGLGSLLLVEASRPRTGHVGLSPQPVDPPS